MRRAARFALATLTAVSSLASLASCTREVERCDPVALPVLALIAAYQRDPGAAERAYRGQRLTVSGRIERLWPQGDEHHRVYFAGSGNTWADTGSDFPPGFAVGRDVTMRCTERGDTGFRTPNLVACVPCPAP